MAGRFAPWGRNALRQVIHQVRLFLLALQFFTRIPIPSWVGFENRWLQQSARYFPWVGALVGAATAGVYALAALLWPPLTAVLLSTVAGILLTGALHEDGFADVCDGFGGGLDAPRIFAIMKDSRIGAYGTIGIGLLLFLKCSTLAQLPLRLPSHGVVTALLLAHPLSRLFPTMMLWRMRYAREEGKAKPMADHMSGAEFLIAALGAMLPALVLMRLGWLRWQALLMAFLPALLLCAPLVRQFQRRIGGFTGDCLGATQQVAEAGLYLGLLAQCDFI